MATKTISVDLEAYERLRRARRGPSESFSLVIKRASWPAAGHTARDLLGELAASPPTGEAVLEQLERGQHGELPSDDAWRAP